MNILRGTVLGRELFDYEIKFKNKGGLVMPLILRFDFADGTFKELRIPVEIWRLNNEEVTKLPLKKKRYK